MSKNPVLLMSLLLMVMFWGWEVERTELSRRKLNRFKGSFETVRLKEKSLSIFSKMSLGF